MSPNRIPEVYYNLAKYYAYLGEAEQSLGYLDHSIQQFDPLYSLKAEFDPDFEEIREELSAYFLRIRDQEAQQLKQKLSIFGLQQKGLE